VTDRIDDLGTHIVVDPQLSSTYSVDDMTRMGWRVLQAERERDEARAEVERLRAELDSVKQRRDVLQRERDIFNDQAENLSQGFQQQSAEIGRLRAALAEVMIPVEALTAAGDDAWELAPDVRRGLMAARTIGRVTLGRAKST
jgi:chromosome segregation ATPase